MLFQSMATLVTGTAFGAALAASGVYMPSVIIDQFRLTDFHMFQVFATAMGSRAQRPVRANARVSVWTPYDANIAGGALVGIGMALSGACPGTVLVQLAQRIPSANATALGALFGAIVYVRTRDWMELKARPHEVAKQAPCKKTISEVFRASEAALYSIFRLGIAGVLSLTRAKIGNSLVPPVMGGLLIGSVQALSLLLISKPLGVSTAQNVLQAFTGRLEKQGWLTNPIIFCSGIIAGSAVLLQNIPAAISFPSDAAIPSWQAFAGGVVMTFGARLGGGCTSGHGLSGLSAMSFSSLLTVGAMFGAGILTQKLM
ncbi:hypothetical protein D6D19_10596 [Aureobasidium pullulans]|uniref:Uncharacterized protein n=1 Tax=Aureobasidium pullulans TaxID=5580 RepID=A0A4S8Z0C2_AURPU|nr:hypothetical protein D6D19_10596 [Aureobasidium pullulans]TIA59187.1 hypothetical protein D6C76_10506 [Aureobasidium pullulans]